jgi:hypothetical protein
LFVILDKKKLPMQMFALLISFVGITSLLFAARYAVYGEIVPATVLAKGFTTYSLKKTIFQGDIQAAKNFLWMLSGGVKYLLPLLFLGLWIPYILLFRKENRREVILWLMASSIASGLFVSLWAGGDFWPYKRLLIPVLPLIIIFIAWAVELLVLRYWGNTQYKKVVLSAVTIFCISWIVFFFKPGDFRKTFGENSSIPFHAYLREFGTFVRDIPHSTTLLTDVAGIMPYYAGINVYVRDLFGLMDIHNAKYGTDFCFPGEGGVCGRTDYHYSFNAPFDIFVYNAKNITKRFVAFCQENPLTCKKYRFFGKEAWHRESLHVIANINHPVSKALMDKFGVRPIPITENIITVINSAN